MRGPHNHAARGCYEQARFLFARSTTVSIEKHVVPALPSARRALSRPGPPSRSLFTPRSLMVIVSFQGVSAGARLASPADVAQLVEHFTRNEGVRGSSPRVGFS
jgi:hypothetical protein